MGPAKGESTNNLSLAVSHGARVNLIGTYPFLVAHNFPGFYIKKVFVY